MPWVKSDRYSVLQVPNMWHAFYMDEVLVQRRPNGWCYKNDGRWISFGDKDMTLDQAKAKMRG